MIGAVDHRVPQQVWPVLVLWEFLGRVGFMTIRDEPHEQALNDAKDFAVICGFHNSCDALSGATASQGALKTVLPISSNNRIAPGTLADRRTTNA